MKRKMIKIDEAKCNGCGNCIPDCPEGALQIIDGKARLISDLFCDGLGACLGTCPTGAMSIEEREAEPYDEKKVMGNVVKGGENVVIAHLKHLKDHNEMDFFNQAIEYLQENNLPVPELEKKKSPCSAGGFQCPGSMMKNLKPQEEQVTSGNNAGPSQLSHWPVQLKLLNPQAPFLQNSDLVVCADCVPFTYPNFHQKFLKNKTLAILCPKLDTDLEQYINKLQTIIENQNLNSITIIHMEVPCCSGIGRIVQEALKRSGKNVLVKDYTISLNGEII